MIITKEKLIQQIQALSCDFFEIMVTVSYIGNTYGEIDPDPRKPPTIVLPRKDTDEYEMTIRYKT